MTTKRYRVGLDIRAYTRRFIQGCLVSALSTMIIMIIGFAVIYGPGIKAMQEAHANEIAQLKTDHESQVNRIESDWSERMVQQEHQLSGKYQVDTSALNATIQQLEADLAASQLTLDRIEVEGEENFDILREYWYVFQRTGDNSGLSADLIQYVDKVCKEWDVNPHWMWAIYWEESNFRARIDNTAGSGARGLGQVMPSTGKSFWENVLGHGSGSFTTDMLYDPYVNVDITVAIIGRHLSNGWTMYQAINQYSGGGGNEYFSEVLATGETHGIKLDDSNWHYPKE